MNQPTIEINGEQRTLEVRSIEELLGQLGYDLRQGGIAVAVNGEVVPRAEWLQRRLEPGDVVELVGAVQGG